MAKAETGNELGGYKNIDLETLRVVAIALTFVIHLVVLFPWSPPHIGTYFWAYGGVDLFFVISGFIITTSLLRSVPHAKDQPTKVAILKAFWIKRIFRILPLAYLWTVIPIVLSIWFNTSGVFGSTLNLVRDGFANVTQTANFHWQECEKPEFAPKCGISKQHETILGPYWSLSTEEQFYLVLPLLLLFLPRRLLVYFLVFVILALLFVDRRVNYFFVLRFDALAAGVLLAFFQTKNWYRALYPKFMENHLLALTTLLIAALMIGFIPALLLAPFAQSLLVLVCTFLVFCATFDKNFFSGKSKWLYKFWAWGGDRSYAFYLIHVPAFGAANELYYRTHHASWDAHAKYYVPVIAFVLLLGLTELCTRYFENPIREYGRRVAKTVKPMYDKKPLPKSRVAKT